MSFAFDSLDSFWAMGRYGAFVWSAWSISALALALLILQTRRARRQFYRAQAQRNRQQQARLQAKQTPQDPERSS